MVGIPQIVGVMIGIVMCGRRYAVHAAGSLTASHFAMAALTSPGFSCAIQWPDCTIASLKSVHHSRIGSASLELIVSQTTSYSACTNSTGISRRQRSFASAAKERLASAFMYQLFGPKKPDRVSAAA